MKKSMIIKKVAEEEEAMRREAEGFCEIVRQMNDCLKECGVEDLMSESDVLIYENERLRESLSSMCRDMKELQMDAMCYRERESELNKARGVSATVRTDEVATRNLAIKQDYDSYLKRNETYPNSKADAIRFLAKTYGLSERQIERILRKKK